MAGAADTLEPAFIAAACALGDANLADYLAHCARTAAGTREVSDGDGLVLFAGGHAYPGAFANGVVRRGAHPGDWPAAADSLDRAERFFAGHDRPFLVWIRDHLDSDLVAECLRRGYPVREPAEGLTGVAADRPPDPALLVAPAGFEVREVDDDAGYSDYLDVVAEVWGLGGAPQALLETVLFSLESLRTDRIPVMVVYRRDGSGHRAVSCCSVFISDSPLGGLVGGMQWAGTRREASGLALGRVATARAWQAAFDAGASMVVGQASQRGTPVWNSIGYRTVTRYRRFFSPPAMRR